MARSEYDGCMVENRNFLLPKFFRRKTFNLNKRSEIYFNAILFSYGEDSCIHSLVGMFEASATLHRIYIPSTDPEHTYRRICAEFTEVNAGGGLVSNRRGDFLLISRNGLWDLPKGHQEEGEDIRTTALREVQEETGIDKIELR